MKTMHQKRVFWIKSKNDTTIRIERIIN